MKRETWKALQMSADLEERVMRFEMLSKRALEVVYSNFIPLEGIKERFEERWIPLYDSEWDLDIKSYPEVEVLFQQVSQADISKTELRKALQQSKLAMEKYLEVLKKKLEEQREVVSKDYDKEMALKAGTLRFVVEEPAVKELFFQWLNPEKD